MKKRGLCKYKKKGVNISWKTQPQRFLERVTTKERADRKQYHRCPMVRIREALYERVQKVTLPTVETSMELFIVDDIKQGIKKLASGKAEDIDGHQAEFLKWGVELLAPHIKEIFNGVIQDGFSEEWITGVVIPLFKSGDTNNPSNYRIIMVNPLMGKLFGSMIERRINRWVEDEGKRAKGQAGFRPKHSTIDHCITLRNLIEKIWDK